METKPENQDTKVIQSLLDLIDGVIKVVGKESLSKEGGTVPLSKVVMDIIEERDALRLQVASLKADVDMATDLFVGASAKIKELKSERARALMALEFCKNRSAKRGGVGVSCEETLSEIFRRASQIIGDDFDSYKTQLDLKPCE
jgi:hypothetical protein